MCVRFVPGLRGGGYLHLSLDGAHLLLLQAQARDHLREAARER